MTEEISNFISSLMTVKNKALKEKVTTKCVYERAYKGIYEYVKIDGVLFIVENE